MIQIYLLSLITFLVIDFVWIGLVAKSFYQKEIGKLMLPKFKLAPALIFYLVYPLALVVLVTSPATSASSPIRYAAVNGSVLGAMAYATYNLTNMSILKDWTWKVVIVDTIWGSFATSLVSLVAILSLAA